MKKKESILITIPEPCSQRWDDMAKTEKGRFCTLCQHTVIDFSILTDAEIINIIKEAAGGKICGRPHPSQLGRELSSPPATQPRSIQLLKRIAAAVLSFQAMATTSFAQKVKQPVTQQPGQQLQKGHAAVLQRGIRGCVSDYVTNTPLSGMRVTIAGAGIETTSGRAGTFFLVLPDDFAQKKVVLQVSYTDASGGRLPGTMIPDEEIDLDTISSTVDVNIYRYPVSEEKLIGVRSYMKPLVDIDRGLGGISVITELKPIRPHRNLFRAIGCLFRKKDKRHD